MNQREHDPDLRSKADLLDVLRRLGTPEATISEIDSKLGDWVDLYECGDLLQSYGLTRDEAISRLGGSP
jgi:hypothetical protein